MFLLFSFRYTFIWITVIRRRNKGLISGIHRLQKDKVQNSVFGRLVQKLD